MTMKTMMMTATVNCFIKFHNLTKIEDKGKISSIFFCFNFLEYY
mgnify:CR=1 FL=1